MKRLAWVVGALALIVAVVLVSVPGTDAKDPTIKEIMGKLHKGANAPIGLLKKDLQEDDPDWPEIQKTTKEFVTLGAALGKNDPPKGDADSWKKLTKQYFDNAKILDDAAKKKDKSGALSAQAKLAGSCLACHKAHRPS